ncbi:MAG: zinc-ribbon domain-containing protein [Deltaproteobacteria bacterium]|nr:zinc-ribbon domain-containing protein [Deltaproteobacteria bacterium]
MIVTCPGCNAKFRVKDETIPPGGAKMQCPKCATMFAARRSDDPGGAPQVDASGLASVPQPIAFDRGPTAAPAEAPAAPVADTSAQAAREWDVRMSGETALPPRDPFYQANPQVAPPPPAAVAGLVTSSMASGPIRPTGPGPLGPPSGESSDPFAHIDLMVPATQPLAGTGAPALERTGPAPAAVSSPPPSGSGVDVRDRQGRITNFKYLPPARQFVSEHAEPDGLEVSIAGSPFTPVKLSSAFSDLDFSRAAPPVIAAESAIGSKKRDEVYPPLPRPIAGETAPSAVSTLLGRIGLVAAAVAAGIALLFMLWQFEVLPFDPYLTRAVSGATGLRSPLVLPTLDPVQEAQRSLRDAKVARDSGALGLAVLSYKRALLFRPGDRSAEKDLAESYMLLGDVDRAAEIAHGAYLKEVAASKPAREEAAQPASKPAPAKRPPRGGELHKAPQLLGPQPAGGRQPKS